MQLTCSCCYLAPETSIACERLAEYEIHFSRDPNDFTHACSEHVGAMLSDVPEQHVYRIRPPLPEPPKTGAYLVTEPGIGPALAGAFALDMPITMGPLSPPAAAQTAAFSIFYQEF